MDEVKSVTPSIQSAAIPVSSPLPLFTTSAATSSTPAFQQLFRLTVVLEEPSQVHSLAAATQQLRAGWHVIAVQPMNEKLLHQACQQLVSCRRRGVCAVLIPCLTCGDVLCATCRRWI